MPRPAGTTANNNKLYILLYALKNKAKMMPNKIYDRPLYRGFFQKKIKTINRITGGISWIIKPPICWNVKPSIEKTSNAIRDKIKMKIILKTRGIQKDFFIFFAPFSFFNAVPSKLKKLL